MKTTKSSTGSGAEPKRKYNRPTLPENGYWLTLPEAARVTGIPYPTIVVWTKKGMIKDTAKIGAVRLVSRKWAEAVRQFMEDGTCPSGVGIEPIVKPMSAIMEDL